MEQRNRSDHFTQELLAEPPHDLEEWLVRIALERYLSRLETDGVTRRMSAADLQRRLRNPVTWYEWNGRVDLTDYVDGEIAEFVHHVLEVQAIGNTVAPQEEDEEI